MLYRVSFRTVLNGSACIEAKSEEEAKELLLERKLEDAIASAAEIETDVVDVTPVLGRGSPEES